MNQSILNFVGKQLIDIGNKIIKGECELTDEQASIILGTVGHIEMTKEEACKYINIHRSRFDDYVRAGVIPKGRKKRGKTTLIWYRDEIDIAIRQCNNLLSR